MKTLLFDPFSGASGDMLLATLISIGADAGRIRNIIETTLEVQVQIKSTNKNGIDATDVHMYIEHEDHTRHYFEIVEIIQNSQLSEYIKNDVLAIFEIMAQAECKVHGQTIENIHFHEVGQKDAIADVIGVCCAIHEVGAEYIYCLPINVGGGTIKAAHGTLPVPAPATLEILQTTGLLFYGCGNRELLTPTGAALLGYFTTSIENIPIGKVIKTGYGAGDANTEIANVLRSIILETESELYKDNIEILETNVDDVTGEVLGYLFEKLLSMGAKDVAIIPITMKKGRSGHIIKVITKPEHSANIAKQIMKETGTLGIRVIPTKHRYTAQRHIDNISITIEHEYFQVPVKIAQDKNGDILHISAEYDNCKIIATNLCLPLKDIIRKVEAKAWEKYGKSNNT